MFSQQDSTELPKVMVYKQFYPISFSFSFAFMLSIYFFHSEVLTVDRLYPQAASTILRCYCKFVLCVCFGAGCDKLICSNFYKLKSARK